MTLQQILFFIIAFITLASAWYVVTARNLFHAALTLMITFLGVAGVYVTLDAGFLAAAQLLVYIGAISILIIFAIMMTRRLMQTTEAPYNSQRWLGLATSLIVFLIAGFTIVGFWPTAPNDALPMAQASDSVLRNSVAALGESFVSPDAYVLPFEVASVLLLAALIGSVIIAWPNTEEDA